MEAAAVAWVCYHTCVPFAAIKSITDIVDQSFNPNDNKENGLQSTREQFESNFNIATSQLTEKLQKVFNIIDHSQLSKLGN